MCDDHDLVAAVDQLRRQLVDVTFDSSRLREEEVADHGDIVRHLDEGETRCFTFDIVNASTDQDDLSKDCYNMCYCLVVKATERTSASSLRPLKGLAKCGAVDIADGHHIRQTTLTKAVKQFCHEVFECECTFDVNGGRMLRLYLERHGQCLASTRGIYHRQARVKRLPKMVSARKESVTRKTPNKARIKRIRSAGSKVLRNQFSPSKMFLAQSR